MMGKLRIAAQPAAEAEPVLARQHEIEDHEVDRARRLTPSRISCPFFAVETAIAVAGQELRDQIADAAVVIDDQEMGRGIHARHYWVAAAPLHLEICKPMLHGRGGQCSVAKSPFSRHHRDKRRVQIAAADASHAEAGQAGPCSIASSSSASPPMPFRRGFSFSTPAAGSARCDGARPGSAGVMDQIKENQDASSLAPIDSGRGRLRRPRGLLAPQLGRGALFRGRRHGARFRRRHAPGSLPRGFRPCQRLSGLSAGAASR